MAELLYWTALDSTGVTSKVAKTVVGWKYEVAENRNTQLKYKNL